jgi:general secretion pathway protein D
MVASTSFNVIIDDAVSDSNVTLSFRDTPLSEALETLTAANNLSYRVVHNTIIVGQREDIGRRLGGYITRAFHLDYADAEAVKQVLIDNGLVSEENVGVYNGEADEMAIDTGGTALSEGEGGVTAGDIREMTSLLSTARRNTLIVTETPQQMDIIAQVVADIDSKPKLVTLETSIVEVTEEGLKNLGFEVPDTISTTIREQTPVSSDGIPLGLWLQTLYRSPYNVALDLQTQIDLGNARILSRPNLSAIDGTQAIYFAGRLLPYITRPATETGGTFTPPEVDFQAVGITLSFKPRVDAENNITIEANPSVSTLLEFIDIGSGVFAPDTQTRQVTATVRVANRETFVIAGLLSEEERESLRKIPLLGDLPLFGEIFRSTKKTKERTEIMVFVTPIIHE